ncbi:MAG: hypothetical protein EBY70_00885 [Burkholderiaceae bacterium]|nr:hypothetical protein [Burkholderiaceae bacterium]
MSASIGNLVGTYRAQEMLTTQVLESMIQAINQLDFAPITKQRIDTVLITGDLTDNAQQNELNWCNTLLRGGKLRPDSGTSRQWHQDLLIQMSFHVMSQQFASVHQGR